jgi:hypothetical protein
MKHLFMKPLIKTAHEHRRINCRSLWLVVAIFWNGQIHIWLNWWCGQMTLWCVLLLSFVSLSRDHKKRENSNENQSPNLINDRCIVAESINYSTEWSRLKEVQWIAHYRFDKLVMQTPPRMTACQLSRWRWD